MADIPLCSLSGYHTATDSELGTGGGGSVTAPRGPCAAWAVSVPWQVVIVIMGNWLRRFTDYVSLCSLVILTKGTTGFKRFLQTKITAESQNKVFVI